MRRRNFFRNLLVLPFAGVAVNLLLHSYQENVTPPVRKLKAVWSEECERELQALYGFRGDKFMECGYVYAPYIPLQYAGVVAVPSKH